MKVFENPDIQIKTFDVEDIVTASNPDGPVYNSDDYATPWG